MLIIKKKNNKEVNQVKRKRRNKKGVNRYTETCAVGEYISMSAHKARRVIDQIRGRPYAETLLILELMPYRACYPILKLVYSAAANANHNMRFNEANLIISKTQVTEGKTGKKLKPRARGRGYQIKRPTCHIIIVLKDLEVKEPPRFPSYAII